MEKVRRCDLYAGSVVKSQDQLYFYWWKFHQKMELRVTGWEWRDTVTTLLYLLLPSLVKTVLLISSFGILWWWMFMLLISRGLSQLFCCQIDTVTTKRKYFGDVLLRLRIQVLEDCCGWKSQKMIALICGELWSHCYWIKLQCRVNSLELALINATETCLHASVYQINSVI